MKHNLLLFISTVVFLLLSACQNYDDSPSSQKGKIYNLSLNASISDYPDAINSRASLTWKDGDKIYMTFMDSKSVVATGIATLINGTWTLTTTSELPSTGSVWVNYIKDEIRTEGTTIYTDYSSATYFGVNRFTNSDGAVSLNVTLSPDLPRIRFKGASGASFRISGLSICSSVEYGSGRGLSLHQKMIDLSITSSGYSPYIYTYINASNVVDIICETDGNKFKRTLNNDKILADMSGYMTLPTESSHNGWQMKDKADPEAVDLGLSVKWASFNIGANAPEDYGDYFAWGETTTKTMYSWSNLKYCTSYDADNRKFTFSKYVTSSTYGTVDNKTTLESQDDVAHVKWGSSWRMPTIAECNELYTKCTWTWMTKNGVNGYEVRSKTNDNSIFLPAAGSYYGEFIGFEGYSGQYLSSSLELMSDKNIQGISFTSSWVYTTINSRVEGNSVRAVYP